MHTYTLIYNEQPVTQDSSEAAHTLPRRTATTTRFGTERYTARNRRRQVLLTVQSGPV